MCSAVERGVEPAAERGLGRGTDLTVDDVAVAHHQERRDALRLEATGETRRLVDVDLDQFHPPGVRPGEALEDGADHPARPAPRCPQINDDGELRPLGHVGEVAIAGVDYPGQRLMAVGAARRAGRSCGHAVLRAAVGAGDDHAQLERRRPATPSLQEESCRRAFLLWPGGDQPLSAGLTVVPGGTSSSMRSRISASRRESAPASRSVSWAIVRGPLMAAGTAGWSRTRAMARS